MWNAANQPINDPNALWHWLRQLAAEDDREPLTAAYELAARVHEGQLRRSAVGIAPAPYIVHPLRVAWIVAEEWGQTDLATLSACLLHDALEDCTPGAFPTVEREIIGLAGHDVSNAVCTLTKPRLPEPVPEDTKARREADYFKELFRAPRWVRLVKCADRVDNLRDARAWGNRAFWERYSSETIGWHLYLARETAPIAEVALFKALVEGERDLRGQVPVWADGAIIDPSAAALIPEHVARAYGAVGLAVQGDTLIVGLRRPSDKGVIEALRNITQKQIRGVRISPEALSDALAAGLYGQVSASPPAHSAPVSAISAPGDPPKADP